MTTYVRVNSGRQHYLDADRRTSICGQVLDASDIGKATEFYDIDNGPTCQHCIAGKRARLRVFLATKGEAISY